jgi:alcohol dehydrogenase
MKASVLHKFRTPPNFEEVDDPVCRPKSVVVELKACGVCRSDHHAWLGNDPDVELPHIMGHELAGIIVEIGSEIKEFSVGDRVTVPFILGCGLCSDCQTGNSTVCDNQETIGFTIRGGFAQFVEIRLADFNLVGLPDSLSFELAAAMGCRVTTAFRALTDRACLTSGEWLAVYGCGGVGTSAVLIAKALGAKVIGIDINSLAL